MSGLAALFHRDRRPVDRAAVWSMLDAVPYRGPDGAAVRVLDNVGLGHARMALTAEEQAEEQPLTSRRTGCMLSSDVRLDNREHLIEALPERPPASTTDAELILRAYEAWGIGAIERLLGDFAFVLWDPSEQRLVCARDSSGQRSLFYRVNARTFAAASEIHQLFQDSEVPVVPNEEHIRQSLVPFFTYQNEKQHATTYYSGIWALPAGHVLVIDQSAFETRRYWDFSPREIRYRTDAEYAEHYLELFSEVVRTRLRTSSPVGVMLSGGLDSSSVACIAQELYRTGRAQDHGFATFSAVFGDLDCDERPLIEDIQAKYGFRAHLISSGTFAGRLQPEPSGFQESPNMGVREERDAIFGAINGAGVRVLLTGHTADACVGGSRRVFDSLLRQGHLRAFWHHLQVYRRLAKAHEPLYSTLGLYCLGPLLPAQMQTSLMSTYLRRQYARHGARMLPPWMPDELRTELADWHLRLLLRAEQQRRFSNPTREDDYRLLYPPEVVRHPTPWTFEERRPFADRRLHQFLLGIPPEQKFSPHPDTDSKYAGQKQIVRRAMRGILPESIRTRTLKVNFVGVWQSEIAQQWPIYEAVFSPSACSEVAARGYINPQQFWSRLVELRTGNFGPDFAYIVKIVDLETWLRAIKLPRPQLVTVAPPWQAHKARAGREETVEQVGAHAS
jgi:asparagine synthase (glutamine-hydrolysing)